ncbi:hypothetical protein CKO15_02195 [Halorhodospira abdelmalekii]|nr:hypothetical protein [Halorhodospira abdelmalekii]
MLLGAALSGCTTYGERMAAVEAAVQDGDPQRALTLLDERPGGSGDRVVDLLNRGALLRMAGKFEASNQALEAAHNAIAEVDPLSVTEQIGSLTVGETAFAYAGAPHDRILLHLIKAFNYLDLGDSEAARVEILRIDLRLQRLADEQSRSAYRRDPFAHYLSGLIFEHLGEPDQALVAYRLAEQAYQEQSERLGIVVPTALQLDLLRLADAFGLDEERAQWQERFALDDWPDPATHRQQAHVVVISGVGLAPRRREQSTAVQDDKGRIHSIALPYYEPRQRAVHSIELRGPEAAISAEPVHDIDAVARILLDEQQAVLVARALARLLVQKELIDQAREVNPAAGLAMNIFTLAADRADTRTWGMLPARYYMARVSLPPGEHCLELVYRGPSNHTLNRTSLGCIELAADTYHFIFDRWVSKRTGSVTRREGM